MSERSSLLLGIDGGGTSTTAWLADVGGASLGRGVAGASNAKAVGRDAARASLGTAIALAFVDASIPRVPVQVACLGLAGFDRPEDRALLEGWSESDGWADRLVLVNDGDLVLAAGTPEGVGVAVIAGTGSIAVGRSHDGRTVRAGGWGHLLGDEGSAYSVALAGLRLVARRIDGREALNVLKAKGGREPADIPRDGGPLAVALCRQLNIAHPDELITAVYAEGMDRTRIAGLAKAVAAVADDDPDVRSWILEPAGFELGQTIRAVARGLDWTDRVLPLAMAGSFLLSTPIVSESMSDYLRRFVEAEVLSTAVPEPAAGAIQLARRALSE